MGATGAAPIPMGASGAGAEGFAGFVGFAGLATGFFLGRPRPGPGRRVMGFWLGSLLRALEVVLEGARPLESALFWARRRPWKCWLGGRVSGLNLQLREVMDKRERRQRTDSLHW